jgi:hypothetical protein
MNATGTSPLACRGIMCEESMALPSSTAMVRALDSGILRTVIVIVFCLGLGIFGQADLACEEAVKFQKLPLWLLFDYQSMGCWGIKPIARRRLESVNVRMSLPSNVICPEPGRRS